MDPNLESLFHELLADSGEGQVHADIFGLNLRREWRRRRGLAHDLFGNIRSMLDEELRAQDRDLADMEHRLADMELWEHCAHVRDVRVLLWTSGSL